LTNAIYYVYDGKRVIQERNTNNTPTTAYTWGPDLSGTLEGAGGIGGMLARSSSYSSGNFTSNTYYHADGNGNITYLEDSSQDLAASYVYDSYGNAISSYGSLASANTHRFSSKECMAGPGLYYYLYRFYDPSLERWPNRDPIEEDGGYNLYEFALNSPVNVVDRLGLEIVIGSPGGRGNNCYSYSCNGGNTIPGNGNTPVSPDSINCDSVMAGVKKDHPEAKP